MKSKHKNQSTTPGIDLQPNLGSKLNILTSAIIVIIIE